ncbi:type VI secretion system membrane subunit TssM [Paracoccus sp. Z118]|uniref:type VI secretion system membrane subunit TssM n=1 Tax=Paracoccus sp. Z118 TaxID=2851017 RepID=UPI001C2C08E1|nr:type VI secretion system membrane subunit TssM [Paracoccus sp. Z118]MBV0890899.1 type VI secretion system membrane subunit TssM [Paracoccus sp. Z118]
MRAPKAILRFLFSRRLWVFIGALLLCLLIWQFGPIVTVGGRAPLESPLARLIAIGAVAILWLFWVLLGQLRAARANQVFVSELARQTPEPAGTKDAAGAEIDAKFQSILAQMKRSRLGHRRFLREMPWYVIIGPPGTGKTTALRQSGLHFPVDLGDDLKGVGGTRNCDWFFTDSAILLDTAGRYTEQASNPESDAAEWNSFLDLLRKHRGRRALNGVIVAISVTELLRPADELRAHGREIRKRLGELRERLGLRLPVYLVITKLDLVPGFDAFFAELSTEEREQVWGATLPPAEAASGAAIGRELHDLAGQVERRVAKRLADDLPLARRAEIFRFPAQLLQLDAPLRLLVDAVFAETRYDEAPWLRGFYLTSATQEGSPIDRLVGELAQGFGLPAPAAMPGRHGEKRSFFLKRLLTDVIFNEAGLGILDPKAEERRRWIWRGTLAASLLAVACLGFLFAFSFSRFSGLVAEQERQFSALQSGLADVAARQVPTDRPDLDLAIEGMDAITAASVMVPRHPLALLGPTAQPQLSEAQRIAYRRGLSNIVEPRMVALLEATIWRQIRDPDYLLGALKTYFMMTGLAPYNPDFVAAWWQEALPAGAPVDPFPTEAARSYQLDTIALMAGEEAKTESDPELVRTALESLCAIPLAVRAYEALMSDSAVTALPEWTPAAVAGPRGAQIFTRLSGRTLQAGLPGAFTYAGFHGTVLPLVPDVAAQAAIDRLVFAGGCDESATADAATLEADLLSLYEQDFIAKWDGFLRDIRLAPITDLASATGSLKDLSSEDSALNRLLRAVVAETELTRAPAEPEADAEGGGPPKGLVNAAAKRLGKVGKLAKKGARLVPAGGDAGAATAEPPGAEVARHFRPLKSTIDSVDDAPPRIGDVVLALGALANELQTVSASPDPEAALLARGGLPELTGAIANVAQGLPPPVNDWVAGIAGDTIAVTREAVVDQLNARLQADVLPFCRAATAGRYPFAADSAIDVTVADFQRLFGPGALMDLFINEQLLPYVDTTARPWQWRADFGLAAERLQPFQKAREIRDALFPGGAGPVLTFTLEPKDLSANASRVSLNVDGQVLVYFNAATRPMPMTWPGADGTNLVSLSFAPVDGSAEAIQTETGAWAFLRLIHRGELAPTDQAELFRLRLGLGSFAASYDLRAASVDNPFDLQMFRGFACPERI